MKEYIKKCIPDYVLSLVMAATLSVTICSGFYLQGSPADNPVWIFAAAAAVLVAAFVFAYRRVLVICGISILIVACVVAVIYGRSIDLLENENANAVFIFFAVCVISSVVTFLLSRTRAGILVLTVLGIEIHAFAGFLQYPTYTWCIVSFAICAAALYLYRIYLCKVLLARLGEINMWRYALQSLIGLLACAAVAVGIFFAVIKPLDPPTQRLKLLTVLERMEITNVLGISDLSIITDPDIHTNVEPERDELSGESEYETAEEKSDTDSGSSQSESTKTTEPQEVTQDQTQAAAYSVPQNYLILKIIAGVILLVAAAVILRLLYKKWWKKKVGEMSPSCAAVNYYDYFYKRLQRAKIKKAPAHTLAEYIEANESRLETFAAQGCDMKALTKMYERVIYCGEGLSREEADIFAGSFSGFHRALKTTVGPLKYYMTIFRY